MYWEYFLKQTTILAGKSLEVHLKYSGEFDLQSKDICSRQLFISSLHDIEFKGRIKVNVPYYNLAIDSNLVQNFVSFVPCPVQQIISYQFSNKHFQIFIQNVSNLQMNISSSYKICLKFVYDPPLICAQLTLTGTYANRFQFVTNSLRLVCKSL